MKASIAPAQTERHQRIVKAAVTAVYDRYCSSSITELESAVVALIGVPIPDEAEEQGRAAEWLAVLPPSPAPHMTGDDKPIDQASSHPEWIWYCESTDGVPVISLGRWPRHPQQRRFKYAEIQETEHDHPAPPAPHLAELEEIKYLVCTAGAPGHMPVLDALARILFLCNRAGVTKTIGEMRTLFASRKDLNNAL